MDDSKKKQVMIAIVVICLVAAAVFTLVLNNPFGGGGPRGPIQMLCVNEECDAAFKISLDEFSKQMGPMSAPSAFTCPECGEESAYTATKCSKCDNVFINDYSISDDYPDTCPECGYSALRGETQQE